MTGWLILTGAITGFLVGLTGVGGGSIMTPILMLMFGTPTISAVGTDLWFAANTKLASAKVYAGNNLIDWPIVRRLWLGSLPASFLCWVWIHAQGAHPGFNDTLKFLIALVIALTATAMLGHDKLHGIRQKWVLSETSHWHRWQPALTILCGAFLGVTVTLTSVGSGAIGAVLLTLLYPFRLPPPRLVATDVIHAIPLTIFAGSGHLLIGNVDFHLLGCLLIGSIPGAILGANVSARVNPKIIRVILACILLSVSYKLFN